MKKFIAIASVIMLLAGCSALGQQSVGQGNSASQEAGTTRTKSITSAKGYQPTQEDVLRYKNSVHDFLEANVPNFSRYGKALVIIDDVPSDNYFGVSLSEVRLISVLESTPSVVVGSEVHSGAIVIRTK